VRYRVYKNIVDRYKAVPAQAWIDPQALGVWGSKNF